MPKLQYAQKRYFISLPAKIVRLMHWDKGDNLELESDLKGKLYLIKKD